MKKSLVILSIYLSATGCLTRAPTDYELDKRAGFATPLNPKISKEDIVGIGVVPVVAKDSSAPMRLGPQVQKVWVYDQTIDNRILQGTWMWIETDKGRWQTETPVPIPTIVPTLKPEVQNRK